MTEAWARCVANGVADEVFWASTPLEVRVLVREVTETIKRRERAASLRAGLIAASIYNTTPQKDGGKVWHPEDFVYTPPRELTGPEMLEELRAWARVHNASLPKA